MNAPFRVPTSTRTLLTRYYLPIVKQPLANTLDDSRRRQNSSVEPFSTFHAVAVAPQVVVPAVRAHEAARWVGLEPALVLAAVPDPVLRSEHPAMTLAVEHGQIAHREPERTSLQTARSPLRDQRFVPGLGFGEWIDGHQDSIARTATA